MTCEDVRRAKGSGTLTRAERASLVNHVRGCRECQTAVMASLAAADVDTIRNAAETIDRDRQDPEYRDALK